MMDTITLIFCEGQAWYSDVIKLVEHGKYTHVAGLILGSTLEAQGVCDDIDRYPATWLHAPDKYVDGVNCKFVTVRVENLAAAEAKARELIGCPYSFHGCVESGMEMLFDIQPPVDGELTVMCSEAWDIILKTAGPVGFSLPEFRADFVAPQRLYNSVIVGAI
jgi:hypothetical protein